MARIAKIDNSIKKNFFRTEKKRKVGIRQKRVYFLIVCEGIKTEPNYFEAMKDSLPNGTLTIADMTVIGAGRNTESLIDFILKYKRKLPKNKFDKIWAVFDRDSFTVRQFNSAINKAKNNSIDCAWSNEAFELWFLLHFQFVNHAMQRVDYQSFLEREVRKKSRMQYVYKKNDLKTYDILKSYGNQLQAIEWAKKLEEKYADKKYHRHNPCTKVHILVNQLLNPNTLTLINDFE